MATVVPLETSRPGVTFELERLEADGARVIVGGRWNGVRGLRFVRPTLVVGKRQLLASLDHKPWPPDRVPWVAAFPWEGDTSGLADATLEVAPSITLSLTSEDAAAPQAASPGDDVETLREALRAVTAERDALASILAALLRSLGR